MKFNEFKNPQLTEEQIVLSYCKGEITKEDAVSRLREAPQDPRVDQLTKKNMDKYNSWLKTPSQGGGGSFFDRVGAGFRSAFSNPKNPVSFMDSPEEQARQDAEATINAQDRRNRRRNRGGQGRRNPGLSIGPNAANAATPPTQYPDEPDDDSGMNTPAPTQYPDDPSAGDSGMNTTPAPTPAPTQRPKVAATAANTRDYDKTMALQKKLIAQGANIKADGLMGPNTRAAMKAFKNTNPATGGMGPGGAGGVAKPKPKATGTGMKSTTTPGSKVKTPGPSVTQNPAYNQTGMDDGSVPQPKPKPKPKMPKAFGIGPRVDDPKGGETVKTPFGFSYKTLSQKDRDSAFGDK